MRTAIRKRTARRKRTRTPCRKRTVWATKKENKIRNKKKNKMFVVVKNENQKGKGETKNNPGEYNWNEILLEEIIGMQKEQNKNWVNL